MTAQAAGPRPATSTLSIPSWAMDVPPVPAPPCEEPDNPVRGLLSQLGRFGDAAHPACAAFRLARHWGRHGPTGRGEEGSHVQAWTQAALPQGEQGQPRQAAERVTTAS